MQECILVVKATILDWFVYDHIVNKVIILTKVAMVLIVTLLLAGRHALWVLIWHIWDEGAEKRNNFDIFLFFLKNISVVVAFCHIVGGHAGSRQPVPDQDKQ